MSANADLAAAAPHVLREYALLADGERGILVGPRGDFAWMCFPRWDDDAMFSSLIGGNGSYAITPAERCVWGGYYEEGSLIWHSRWITNGSIIECREALALPSRRDRAVVLRRITAIRGPASMRVSLNLRGGFGEEPARRLKRDDAGIWRGLSRNDANRVARRRRCQPPPRRPQRQGPHAVAHPPAGPLTRLRARARRRPRGSRSARP